MSLKLLIAAAATILLLFAPVAIAQDEEPFQAEEPITITGFQPSGPSESCSRENATGVCVSIAQSCQVPSRREMAERTKTLIRSWTISKTRCQASFNGRRLLDIILGKDELLTSPGFSRVWQFGQRFRNSNEATITFLPSHAGFFYLRAPQAGSPSTENAQSYFARNLGGHWLGDLALSGMFYYLGPPAQAFVVPRGWVLEVDGQLYPTGYLMTADHFIVRQSRVELIFPE